MTQKQSSKATYDAAHRELVRRVRRTVRLQLPKTATVLVVSMGDPAFLEVGGQQGWHFPQNKHGAYLGYHPTDSAEITTHLETLRARGGQYLLIPRSGFWWLERCPAFKHYLESSYRVAIRQEDTCLLFDLRIKIERLPPLHSYIESELTKQLASLCGTNSRLDWRRRTPLLAWAILLSLAWWLKQQVLMLPHRLLVFIQSKTPLWRGSIRTFSLEWVLTGAQAWQTRVRRDQPGIGQSSPLNRMTGQAAPPEWTQPQLPVGNWLHRRAYQVQWHLLQDTPPFFDLAGENVIFLAGSGRSGTTWVQEMINYNDDFRILFEPFWHRHVPVWPVPTLDRIYLRPTSDRSELAYAAQRILRGRLRSKWADRWNHAKIYHHRLIKDIRTNLMLKWLQHQLPTIKIVFLMRHPCATVSSQLGLGWGKIQSPLDQILAQSELIEDFLLPFQPLLHQPHDIFEQLILLWAVENYVPLRQFGSDEMYLLFYEELCTNPEAELTRLFAFLQAPLPANLADVVARPSPLAQGHSAIKTGASLIDGWRAGVSTDQVARAVTLLGHFGLNQIYNEASMPNAQAAKQMLLGNTKGHN